MGHSRQFRDARATSAYPPTAAVQMDIAACLKQADAEVATACQTI
ncbi:MAG: hypothetical protein WCE52_14700 [Candidatus Acidiferrum sp.]